MLNPNLRFQTFKMKTNEQIPLRLKPLPSLWNFLFLNSLLISNQRDILKDILTTQ